MCLRVPPFAEVEDDDDDDAACLCVCVCAVSLRRRSHSVVVGYFSLPTLFSRSLPSFLPHTASELASLASAARLCLRQRQNTPFYVPSLRTTPSSPLQPRERDRVSGETRVSHPHTHRETDKRRKGVTLSFLPFLSRSPDVVWSFALCRGFFLLLLHSCCCCVEDGRQTRAAKTAELLLLMLMSPSLSSARYGQRLLLDAGAAGSQWRAL